MDPLTFEVVDFPSVYHDLLGRLCFAKFMAIPNYSYLKLKIPGPKHVITVEGSFEQVYYSEQDCVTEAATLYSSNILPDHANAIERVYIYHSKYSFYGISMVR
jgi:hypothetical protein